jgi:hypothetical protein
MEPEELVTLSSKATPTLLAVSRGHALLFDPRLVLAMDLAEANVLLRDRADRVRIALDLYIRPFSSQRGTRTFAGQRRGW